MANPTAAHLRRHLVPFLAALGLGCATIAMDTETDCIQRHPGLPEACGLTASEAAIIMTAGIGATGGHAGSDVGDYVDDLRLPAWKNRCLRTWHECADGRFTGPCTDCLRRCEGQHEWPLDMCGPKTRKR
ncbi:Lipoprotein [Corallococcus soli]